MKVKHSSDYRKLRAPAYPPIGDQLDAVYKLAKMMAEEGAPIPQEVRDWIIKIDDVKTRFRKTEIMETGRPLAQMRWFQGMPPQLPVPARHREPQVEQEADRAWQRDAPLPPTTGEAPPAPPEPPPVSDSPAPAEASPEPPEPRQSLDLGPDDQNDEDYQPMGGVEGVIPTDPVTGETSPGPDEPEPERPHRKRGRRGR